MVSIFTALETFRSVRRPALGGRERIVRQAIPDVKSAASGREAIVSRNNWEGCAARGDHTRIARRKDLWRGHEAIQETANTIIGHTIVVGRLAIHVLRTKSDKCGCVQTIICRVRSLLYSGTRSIWRRVTVIGLLKTVRARTKAIVCRSKSKGDVPGCLRSLRVVIASQAIGIGDATGGRVGREVGDGLGVAVFVGDGLGVAVFVGDGDGDGLGVGD